MGKLASFYCESLSIVSIKLDESLPRNMISAGASQHLKSRRIQRGERLEFLNGKGLRAECECEDIQTQSYRVKKIIQEDPLRPDIQLCLPLPKGDLLSESVTQAAEIGVGSICFLKSDHAQIPKDLDAPPLVRAQRIADAAIEQCSRAWRMDFVPGWHTLEKSFEFAQREGWTCIVADEELSSQDLIGFVGDAPEMGTQKILLFVGPEGGWSDRERQLFDGSSSSASAPVYKLGLGKLVLRVPTAIVAATFYLRNLSK